MTRSSFIRFLKISGVAIVVILIIGYATWRSLEFARGPHITVIEPADWSSATASTTIVRGQVERAHIITLNGRPILIDESGHFSEIITVFPGMNIWTFVARDRFDRVVTETIRVSR